jgi:hypothetical protein
VRRSTHFLRVLPPSFAAASWHLQNQLQSAAQADQFVDIALAFLVGGAAAFAGAGKDGKDGGGGGGAVGAGGGVNPQVLLDKFAADYAVSNTKGLKNGIASLLYFFSECLKRNLSAGDVRSDLLALGLSDERAGQLADKYKRSFVALSASMIGKTLTVNELIDMEWKFGVTASSSSVAKVGTCFLQLKLVIDRGGHKEVCLSVCLSGRTHARAPAQGLCSGLTLCSSARPLRVGLLLAPCPVLCCAVRMC